MSKNEAAQKMKPAKPAFTDGILVIGSMHLDIWGDYPPEQRNVIDKIGNITFTIGGTAYNIAYNLERQQEIPVALFTILRKTSKWTEYLRAHIEKTKIHREFIHYLDDVPEAAYLGMRCEKDLTAAVCSTPFESESVHLDRTLLQKGIAAARLVVVDCNLLQNQVHAVMELATSLKKPVFAAGVSEKKVFRLKPTLDAARYAAVQMNHVEAAAIFGSDYATARTPDSICKEIHAESVYITQGKEGYWVAKTGADEWYKASAPPVNPGDIKSTSGAGDAVLSALVHLYYHDKALDDSDKTRDMIWGYLSRVLMTSGSTVDCRLKLDEVLEKPPVKHDREESVAEGVEWWKKKLDAFSEWVQRRLPRPLRKPWIRFATYGAVVFGVLVLFCETKEVGEILSGPCEWVVKEVHGLYTSTNTKPQR